MGLKVAKQRKNAWCVVQRNDLLHIYYLLLQLSSQDTWAGDGPSPCNNVADHSTFCITCICHEPCDCNVRHEVSCLGRSLSMLPYVDRRYSPARACSWSVTQFSKLRSAIARSLL